MNSSIAKELEDLPKVSGVAVTTFVTAARQVFRDDLRSVILYGSGAEGRLRPTSDINLVLVLSSFDPAKATAVRSQFSYAESACRLTAMFLLESEVVSAVELFAQKFSDILRRHRVLYGPDPFASLSVPRSAEIWRLKQVLLNLTRLREAYVEYGAPQPCRNWKESGHPTEQRLLRNSLTPSVTAAGEKSWLAFPKRGSGRCSLLT